MERWLTPHIVANQNLTVNFKFKIQPGKMIDPLIVNDQNLVENFKI